MLDGLHIDSAIAATMGMPFAADPHVQAAVARKIAGAQAAWRTDHRGAVEAAWFSLDLPDWGAADWDTVRRKRESAAGHDFRRVVAKLAGVAAAVAAGGGDDRAVADAAKAALFRESLAELEERRASYGGTVLNFLLNILPFGGVLASGNDLRKLVREQQSWVSVLRGPRPRWGVTNKPE